MINLTTLSRLDRSETNLNKKPTKIFINSVTLTYLDQRINNEYNIMAHSCEKKYFIFFSPLILIYIIYLIVTFFKHSHPIS